MRVNDFKGTHFGNAFFVTLREQQANEPVKENPYALREDLIKPLPPNGHLVHTNILNAPKHFVRGLSYDLKSLKKGFNGTANDHELGQLNSIGLVTGGAALATYLATRKQTVSSKAMEFVGVGSFLASMALWPIIAIQIPTRLIHGFDVRQKYVDSLDREKPFFNDPQYIPWDLYTEEEIYKFGDRMGVPKNINNRRDYIQEKMRKVATQDKTLWMLSAGFAVPIMSALICNVLEQPVKNISAYFQDNHNKKILQKALNSDYEPETSDMYKRLDSFIELHKGQGVNEGMVRELTEIIGYDGNSVVNQKLLEELKYRLTSRTAILNPDNGNRILGILRKNLSSKIKDAEAVNALLPSIEELTAWLNEGSFLNRELAKGDFVELNKLLSDKIREKLSIINTTRPEAERIAPEKILVALNNRKNAQTINIFHTTNPSMKLDENIQNLLRSLTKELATVGHKGNIVKDYIFTEVSQAPETRLANFWNKAMGDVFSALNIPWKQMDEARSNRDLMTPLLRENFDRIASDKGEFENVMQKLAEIAKRLDEFDDVVSENGGKKTFFEEIIGKVLNPSAKKLEELGFKETALAIAGNGADSESSILRAYASNRLLGVKSTIYRLISALDMHRRIATMTNVYDIQGSTLARELKEEIVELSKVNVLSAHRSDFAVKFFFNGNPNPNYEDVSELEIKGGKVQNKYYRAGTASYVDVSSDPSLYRGTMGLMYDGELHPQTRTIMGDKLAGKIAKYRSDCLNFFGNEYYFVKHESMLATDEAIREAFPSLDGGVNHVKNKFSRVPNKLKFLMTGVSLDDLAMKYANQKHNSRVWMKLFGGLGAGILGLTVLAQFFFGKTPYPKKEVQA